MTGPRSILLVEDNSFDAKVFCRAIEGTGLELPVRIARDGVEALAVLERQQAEGAMIVVTDLKMPRMGGIELLRRIRENEALNHLPVFAMTTSTLASDCGEAEALGIEAYIRKTGDEQALIDPIVAFLAKDGGQRP